MGTGWGGFDRYPFSYCHAKIYREHPRTNLVGFVEPDEERRAWGAKRWETRGFQTLEEGLAVDPDIVSICTQPDLRRSVLEVLPTSVRGVLCEKPYGLLDALWRFQLQIHYPRRFCPFHEAVRQGLSDCRRLTLVVWAKKDMTTVVHFTHLARWFGASLVYHDNSREIPSTNSYTIHAGKWAVEFRNGGLMGGFMERALGNLLDAMEGKADLLSPAENAIQSEAWAAEILADHAAS
mgnify:CR=1 FL=1